jgi:hypothetical protein
LVVLDKKFSDYLRRGPFLRGGRREQGKD